MLPTNDPFKEAEQAWDLASLYGDLASVKGKHLSQMEKLHLKGLLCGYSPGEMATKLKKNLKGIESDLSASIYSYVKALLGKDDSKIGNWSNIAAWLETAGYKYKSSPDNDISDKNIVNVTNIRFENNKIKIGVYLQIIIPTLKDFSLQELDNLESNESSSE